MNSLALIIITVLVPLLALLAIKIYGCKNLDRLIKVFAILLFAFDLFRFFYNASLFENATTPAIELKFSYLAVYSIIMFFAVYNKGKFGDFMRRAVILTCLLPMILALFNSNIYTNSLDTYAVIKGVYFLESGLSVLLAILICMHNNIQMRRSDLLCGEIIAFAYVLVNMCSILFWNTKQSINWLWSVQMLVCLMSVVIVYFVIRFYNKRKRNSEKST